MAGERQTLLDAITGVAPIAHGEIYLKGHAVHELPVWHRIQQGLSVLPSRNHFGSMTVTEVGRLSGVKQLQTGDTRLNALAGRKVSSLSGGEKQRVGIVSVQPSSVGGRIVHQLQRPRPKRGR